MVTMINVESLLLTCVLLQCLLMLLPKSLFNNNVFPKQNEGNYDLQNKRLCNSSDPVLANDVATVQYVNSLTPKSYTDHWEKT